MIASQLPGRWRRKGGDFNGTDAKATAAAAWGGLALEADGLLMLHAPEHEDKRALVDDSGKPIRGRDNRPAAEASQGDQHNGGIRGGEDVADPLQ